MATTTLATCKNCHEEIEWSGTEWVETRSGDDGGYFDMCPETDGGEGAHVPVGKRVIDHDEARI